MCIDCFPNLQTPVYKTFYYMTLCILCDEECITALDDRNRQVAKIARFKKMEDGASPTTDQLKDRCVCVCLCVCALSYSASLIVVVFVGMCLLRLLEFVHCLIVQGDCWNG